MSTEDEVYSGTGETPDHLKFDEQVLEDYLKTHIDGFVGPLTVEKFKGGQSNPTYLLKALSGHYVLRRKPPGKLLPSAHAIDREYKIITALKAQNFPVPRTYILCEDENIIGTAFFVMDFIDGRIFWDAQLGSCEKAERRDIYLAMADAIADLHMIDVSKAGLDDYGKKGGYFARQIKRWSSQYKNSETQTIKEMDALIAWLPDNIPEGDQTTLVHGDFRLDNLIFDPHKPEIIATLDWELSTLGHPLADFTYFLMTWHFPPQVRGGLAGVDLAAAGIPSLDEMVSRYGERTKGFSRSNGSTQGSITESLDYCLAYNMFRLAAIVQGVYFRGLQGNASSDQSLKYKEQIPGLAKLGWYYAVKAGAQ